MTSAQKKLAKEMYAILPTEPWRHSKCQEQRAGKELPNKHGGSPAPSSPNRHRMPDCGSFPWCWNPVTDERSPQRCGKLRQWTILLVFICLWVSCILTWYCVPCFGQRVLAKAIQQRPDKYLDWGLSSWKEGQPSFQANLWKIKNKMYINKQTKTM